MFFHRQNCRSTLPRRSNLSRRSNTSRRSNPCRRPALPGLAFLSRLPLFPRLSFLPRPALALGLALTAVLAGAPARALCTGEDLIAALPPEARAALQARADAAPFAQGNHWLATKGAAELRIFGTMHIDDPRMDALAERLAPEIAAADRLFLEGTKVELARAQDEMGRRPELIYLTEGPSLLERLPPEEWEMLKTALAERGIPSIMAAKMQPWFAGLLMSIPACARPVPGTAVAPGLDTRLMDIAEAAGVAMVPLEPYDTVFRLLGKDPLDEQIEYLRMGLPLADRGADNFVTLANAYFAEEGRMIWEFSRDQAMRIPGLDPEVAAGLFAEMERELISDRNRSWIEVLRRETGGGATPVHLAVAVGAGHLSGEEGLLALLAAEGWRLERLPF